VCAQISAPSTSNCIHIHTNSNMKENTSLDTDVLFCWDVLMELRSTETTNTDFSLYIYIYIGQH